MQMMFAVCLSSFLFIMTSSFSGMPISGTHTVVGALLGTGLYASGYKHLNWAKLGTIVLSWVISPLLAAFLAFVLFLTVVTMTMNTTALKYNFRLLMLQSIVAVCFISIVFVLKTLLDFELDNFTSSDHEFAHKSFWQTNFTYILIVLALIVGTVICRLIVVGVIISNLERPSSISEGASLLLKAAILPFSF